MRPRAWIGLLSLVFVALLAAPAHAGVDVNHAKVCAQAATASTADVDCADWNADHLFTGGAQGQLLYRDTGEAQGSNWTGTSFLWDETTTSLLLFGGTVGTDGSRVVSLGCGSTVAPTTSPTDTVQVWCADLDAEAGSAGLLLRDERGGQLRVGTFAAGDMILDLSNGTSTFGIDAFATGTGFGSSTNHGVELWVNNVSKFFVTADSNIGINTSTFGTSAAGVVALAAGTCETSSPADQASLCVKDRNGAGTASWFKRDEEGRVESPARWVHARSTNEATVTNVAADLHTLNSGISIPVTDGVVIRGLFRKTTGAAATCSLGLKINTTQVVANTAVCSSTNQVENGYFEFRIWNRATSYLRPVRGEAQNNVANTVTNLFASVDLANATITDIRITGVTGSSSVTLGVRDVVVERIAGF